MTDIFADGIRSIAVTNGVLRIELMQYKHNREKKKLEPESAGSLLMPVHSLKDLTAQLNSTLEKVLESEKAAATTATQSGIDEALKRL